MSESYDPGSAGGEGGPQSRPSGDGLPPKTGGGMHRPGAQDAVDTGMEGDGDRGEDAGGGMLGEG